MAARKMKIEFGLMNIDCRRESAVQTSVELKSLCVGQEGKDAHPPTPLKQDPSYCATCGPVDRDHLVKGHGSGTTWTVLSADQVSALSEKKHEFSEHTSLKIIAHQAGEFLAATTVGSHTYYVTPEATDAAHYALLVRLIEAHPELTFAGLLSLSTGGDAYLWSLRVHEGVLVLEERIRPEALKPAPQVEGEVNEQLLAMVETSLGMFIAPFDVSTYEDKYAAALNSALAEGQTVSTDSATPVVKQSDDDLMAKLAALNAGGVK